MQIEAMCPACGARYRVPADFVGRKVLCKKCSSRFAVAESTELDADQLSGDAIETSAPSDDTRAGAPAPPPDSRQAAAIAAMRRGVDLDSDEDDDARGSRRRGGRRRKNDRAPLLPPELSEGILPLVLAVTTLGLSAWLLIKHAVASANPLMGFVFLAVGAAGYMLLIVPLAQKAVQSAADTSDFSLPNGVWLQTFGMLGIPTLLAIVGYFNVGIAGAIWFGLLGLVVMSGLMMLVYGAPPLGAVLAGLLTSTFFAIGAAVTFGAAAGLWFLLDRNGVIMPWDNRQLASANTTPGVTPARSSATPAPSAANRTPTDMSMKAPLDKPSAIATPANSSTTTQPLDLRAPGNEAVATLFPIPDSLPGTPAQKPSAAPSAPSPTPTQWSAAPDPVQAPVKWANQTLQTIEVQPPVRVLHSDPPGPFVAVIDRDSCDVFDVRTARRAGQIKQDFNAAQVVLHPGGGYVAAVRWTTVGADGVSAVPAPRGLGGPAGNYVLEVFAVAGNEARSVVRVAAPAPPAPLGYTRQSRAGNFWFAGDNGFVTAIESPAPGPPPAGSPVAATPPGPTITVRDLKSGAPPKSFAADVGADSAISPGGRYLASLKASRLSVYDLSAGTLAGQTAVPVPWQVVRAIAFSPAGDRIAAVLDAGTAPWHMVVWDFATGAALQDVALPGAYSADWAAGEFHWLADGSGVAVGNDLLNLETSSVVYTIPSQTAGQVTGKLLRVLWPDQAVFEFLAAGNSTRLLYKGVPLPKSDIDAQIKAARAGAVASAPPAPVNPTDPGTSPAPSHPGQAQPVTPPPGMPALPTAPVTPDPAPPALTAVSINPQLSALLKQVDGGQASDAVPQLLEMSKTFPKSLRTLTDEQVVALHALGVGYMKLGDVAKARDPIDRAANSGRTSKALLLNRAKLDLQSPGLLVRGIQEVDRALTQFGVDEETLNLMGHGLKVASSRASTASEVRRLVDKYMAYEKQLESTRPGMRRWGSRWMSQAEYDMTARPAVLVDEERFAQSRLEDARRQQKIAQAAYDEARRAAFMNQQDGNLRWRLDRASDALRNATATIDRRQSELNDAQARFPKPDWNPNFDPLPVDTSLRADTK